MQDSKLSVTSSSLLSLMGGRFTRGFLGVPVSHCTAPVGSVVRLRHVRYGAQSDTPRPYRHSHWVGIREKAYSYHAVRLSVEQDKREKEKGKEEEKIKNSYLLFLARSLSYYIIKTSPEARISRISQLSDEQCRAERLSRDGGKKQSIR